MLYGIPNAAGRIALGAAILVTSARTVEILAQAVCNAVSKGLKSPDEPKLVTKPATGVGSYIDLTTAYAKKSWSSLGISTLENVVVGMAALYAARRFCPDLATSASCFLRNVVGI